MVSLRIQQEKGCPIFRGFSKDGYHGFWLHAREGQGISSERAAEGGDAGEERSPDVGGRNAQPSNPAKTGAADFVVVYAEKAGPAPERCGPVLEEFRRADTRVQRCKLIFRSWHNCTNAFFQSKLGTYPRKAWESFLKAYGLEVKMLSTADD